MESLISVGHSEKLDLLVECHRRLVEHFGRSGDDATSEGIILDSFRLSLSLYMADWHLGSGQRLEDLVAVFPAQVPLCAINNPPQWTHIAARRLRGLFAPPWTRANNKDHSAKIALGAQIESQDARDKNDLETDSHQLGYFDFCPLTREEKDDFTNTLAVRRRKAIAGVVRGDQPQQTNAA